MAIVVDEDPIPIRFKRIPRLNGIRRLAVRPKERAIDLACFRQLLKTR